MSFGQLESLGYYLLETGGLVELVEMGLVLLVDLYEEEIPCQSLLE